MSALLLETRQLDKHYRGFISRLTSRMKGGAKERDRRIHLG